MIQVQKKKKTVKKKVTRKTKGEVTPIKSSHTIVKEDSEDESEEDTTNLDEVQSGPVDMPGVVSIKVSQQQMDNILNIKKASELTNVDELKYENGRLRTMLELWSVMTPFEGKLYLIQVDPLNREVKMLTQEQS